MSVPRVPVTAKQGILAPAERAWVEPTVWTARMLAALGNGVRGGKWFSLIDKLSRAAVLEAAWQHVSGKRGAAGVDRISVARFAAHSARYLQEVRQAVCEGRYQPQPVRRVEIPKSGGKKRLLGIPTVKDRIVQTGLKFVLEPIFEQEFVESSYGFRPGRGCKDALREVDRHLKAGYGWVLDADIQSYFECIPHERLLARVVEHISDGRILALLKVYLEQEVMHGLKQWTPTSGTPQGAVISPLLANVYLHPLDVLMQEEGLKMIRYADDIVVLCQSEAQAGRALARMQQWLADNGLSLHPDKTHIGDARQAGQGFDFLGYHFEAGRREVRKRSRKALRMKIKARTRRSRGESMAMIIRELNPILRGWFNYFKHAKRGTFPAIDGFVRRRLRAIRRKQEKRPGRGHCRADHQRWPNAYFANLGLFTLTEAHALASQSR